MSLAHQAVSSEDAHLNALRIKHSDLSTRIEQEESHAAGNDAVIKQLKLEKLKLKESIEKEEQNIH